MALLLGSSAASPAVASGDALDKINARLFDVATHEVRPFLVVLHEQADLSAAQRLYTKEAKGTYVFEALTEVALRRRTVPSPSTVVPSLTK